MFTGSHPSQFFSRTPERAFRSPIEELFVMTLFRELGARRLPVSVLLQAPIGRYFADVLVESGTRQIVAECDGHEFHERTKSQAAHDKARDRYMSSRGIVVMRFTGSEIHRNASACVCEVLDILFERQKSILKHQPARTTMPDSASDTETSTQIVRRLQIKKRREEDRAAGGAKVLVDLCREYGLLDTFEHVQLVAAIQCRDGSCDAPINALLLAMKASGKAASTIAKELSPLVERVTGLHRFRIVSLICSTLEIDLDRAVSFFSPSVITPESTT